MGEATVTAITTMFTGLAGQITPIMTPIAVSAVPVFAIFIAIKYGKDLWQLIAKKS